MLWTYPRPSACQQWQYSRVHTQRTTFTKIYLHAVLQGFWDKYQTRLLLGQPGVNDDPEEVPQTDADMRSFIDDMSMATYGHGPAIYEIPDIWDSIW